MAKNFIDFSKYYINQADSYVANLKLKDGETVHAAGCGVCDFAMIVSWATNLYTTANKNNIVQTIINKCTNVDGNLTYAAFSYANTNFTFEKTNDMAQNVLDGVPTVCQLNGHYVLINGVDTSVQGFMAYHIEDSGCRANTTLDEPMAKYGEKIKSKRYLKIN